MSIYIDHSLKLTYEDLKQIPEDDPYRHEIIDGIHVASPSPVYRHQTISRRMHHQLYGQIEVHGYGDVVYAPMDVELSIYDIVEPDILVVLRATRHIIERTHVVGAPDLLVEILSPSTAGRDLGIKRERYAKSSVPEYWIVDPDEETVLVLHLGKDDYNEIGRFHEQVDFAFPEDTASVDLVAVWAPDTSTPGRSNDE